MLDPMIGDAAVGLARCGRPYGGTAVVKSFLPLEFAGAEFHFTANLRAPVAMADRWSGPTVKFAWRVVQA